MFSVAWIAIRARHPSATLATGIFVPCPTGMIFTYPEKTKATRTSHRRGPRGNGKRGTNGARGTPPIGVLMEGSPRPAGIIPGAGPNGGTGGIPTGATGGIPMPGGRNGTRRTGAATGMTRGAGMTRGTATRPTGTTRPTRGTATRPTGTTRRGTTRVAVTRPTGTTRRDTTRGTAPSGRAVLRVLETFRELLELPDDRDDLLLLDLRFAISLPFHFHINPSNALIAWQKTVFVAPLMRVYVI
jgi:hypothetical protein